MKKKKQLNEDKQSIYRAIQLIAILLIVAGGNIQYNDLTYSLGWFMGVILIALGVGVWLNLDKIIETKTKRGNGG